jgi:hypothetical protein
MKEPEPEPINKYVNFESQSQSHSATYAQWMCKGWMALLFCLKGGVKIGFKTTLQSIRQNIKTSIRR